MSGPLVQAIGWALLHLLWQGVLVAAILAAALALLQRQSANARYLASCGALLLLVALGVATAYRAYQPGLSAAADSSAPPAAISTVTIAAESDSIPSSSTDLTSTALASITAFAGSHLSEIVAIWLAGVLILSARLIAGWIGARRLAARGTQAAGEQWERSLWRIASSLRLWRPIRLLESAAVEVPTVIGWIRPVVLLPVASFSGLSAQQIEMVLAHELAHIRRHDFIVNLMQSVVETLLFYHPAVWWISRRIRVEREHCCDDLAVAVFGDPIQYARALTRFEELRLSAAQSMVAANGGSLLTRIRRLVLARAESANWSSRWAAGAALLTVVTAILVAPAFPLFANRDEQTPPAKTVTAPAHDKTDCDKAKDKTKCDKSKNTSETTVEVTADDSSDDSSDDPSENSDDQSAPEVQATPRPTPVIAPHVAVDIGDTVATAMEASGAAMDEARAAMAFVTPEPPMVRMRRRHHIGEGGKLSVDDLITLRTAGVDPKYINEMRNAGIGELSLDDIVDLRMQGVTPGYVKEMESAGYSNLNAQQLLELRIAGVTPAFIKSLADAGYKNLSAKELARLRMSGVDAEFIRELSKYRTK